MYPNSNPNPSYPQQSSTGRQQLTRYSSAPSSVFDSSAIFLSAGGIHSSSETNSNNNINSTMPPGFGIPATGSNLTMSTVVSPPPSLTRHSSSPPGFFNHLTASNSNTGFTVTNGYSNSQATSSHEVHKPSRFGTQLNFTSQLGSDHQNNNTSSSLKRAQSTSNGFSISSWENDSSFEFGGSSTKRGKLINGDIDLLSSFSDIDAQLDLSEMAGAIDNMMHIPENSVACKIRAKRGFATHPRSIAERDRRTRISGKLKKLQDLVPNMDKQTSYSEMLDLAIQHIQGLQFQIQKLNEDVNNCTCGCKPKN